MMGLPAVDRPATPPARLFTRAENLAVRREAAQVLGAHVRSATTARELLAAHMTTQHRAALTDLSSGARTHMKAHAFDAPRLAERPAATVEGLKMQARALDITPSNHTKKWLTAKVSEGIAQKPSALATWRASGRLAPAFVAVAAAGAYMTSTAKTASAAPAPGGPRPQPAPQQRGTGPVAVTYTTGAKAGTTEYRRRPGT
jgi:hypothetical protein